ncbi:MAG: SMC-Scp complex subunit ScpB [Rhodothermales bacterium]|nr:SMC-Scp complex subunit ScpB [Rhodothermales bacterium]
MNIETNGSDSGIDLDELAMMTEALIFGADEPVGTETIVDVFVRVRGGSRPTIAEVEAAVDRLNAGFEAGGRCVRIYEWAEGYRMATTPEVAPYLKVFLDQKMTRRLSRSLLETLAVVAYKQPVTKPEVDFVRGVDSDYGLRKLMELDMVDVIGRSDAVGRPLLYGTSRTFLEKFAMKGLDDLPNLREVEELLNDPSFNTERARLLLRDSLMGLESDVAPAGESTESAIDSADSGVPGAPTTNGNGLAEE